MSRYKLRTTQQEREENLSILSVVGNGRGKWLCDVIHDLNFMIGFMSSIGLDAEKGTLVKGSSGLHVKTLFADGLRLTMLRNNISQSKLSILSGVSPKHVGLLQDGSGNPTFDTVEKVAESLGATAMDFLSLGEVMAVK